MNACSSIGARSLRRGRLLRSFAAGLLLALSASCALAAKNTRASVDRGREAYARELDVATRAPRSLQRFEEARRRARASKRDPGARGDQETEARLLLELAIAEAERELSSRARLEEEQQLAAIDARIVALQAEQSELARANELRGAQAIAREEAARSLARAAQRPSLRVKLAPEAVRSAALALLERAELVQLTLQSFDQQTPELARLSSKLREARAQLDKDPETSLARADQALFASLSLLAALRGDGDAPSPEEKATLAEELELAGLRAERNDRGLAGVLATPFHSSAPTHEAARVLARLCALSKAHPRGAVHVRVAGQSANEAEARARTAKSELAKAGCSGERYAFDPSVSAEGALEATFLAF